MLYEFCNHSLFVCLVAWWFPSSVFPTSTSLDRAVLDIKNDIERIQVETFLRSDDTLGYVLCVCLRFQSSSTPPLAHC